MGIEAYLKRAIFLYYLSLVGAWHRLKYDLAREMVIFLCSLTLIALFYYIFNDFLNIEIQKLSAPMRDRFGESLAYILLSSLAITCGLRIAKERQECSSYGNAFLRLGEMPSVARIYWCLRVPTLISIFYWPAWYISHHVLVSWHATYWAQLGLAMLGISSFLGFFSSHKSTSTSSQALGFYKPLLAQPLAPAQAMLVWRLKQLFLRNRLSKFCILLGLFFASFQLINPVMTSPISYLVALALGLMLAFALVLQMANDLECAWIEKNLGISHDQYMMALMQLSLIVGSLAGTIMLFANLLASGLAFKTSFSFNASLFAIAFTPAFLSPYILFQIDGRRPGITMLSLLLSSLFVTTAIYASLISLALLPVIAYYGLVSQKGRFYRA